MITFLKDQSIYRGEIELRIVRTIDVDQVQLENVKTGELSNHKTFNLLAEYVAGELCTAAQRKHALATGVALRRKPARMEHMSTAAKKDSHRRIDYLVRLERKGSFESTVERLCGDIEEVSRERGELRPPHHTTVYRWRRRFLDNQRDIRAVFCQFDKQGGKGQSRLSPKVEAIIFDKIENVFLAKPRSSAEEVHNAVFLEISRRNTQRIEPEWLAVPGLRTVQRRLMQLYAFEVAVGRFGQKEAERMFANHLGARRVARILELVEIDHSPVDLLVTDENGVVVARPTITVVLDRKSRCLLGYHLSLAGHGVPAVFSALRHAMLPKTYLREKYADLDLEWPCFGWAETVLCDNGSEFHAEAVRDALSNLGIITEFAKSRDPDDKPHVERFLKTFNYSFIHRLPGTTLAKVHHRIGFKAEDEAGITLEELDRIIHVWVCSVYHIRPHAGLDQRTPYDVWKDGAEAHPPQLKANKEDLDIEFAEVTESALQHYGIDLNTHVYVSTRLLTLRRMLPPHSMVFVKWPREGAGHVFVWDPIEQEYFKVPNKNPEYDGLTVPQAAAVKKARASGDPDYKLVRATAEHILADMVDTALSDKKLKNRRSGAKLANQTSNDARGTDIEVETRREVDDAPCSPLCPSPAEELTLRVDIPEYEGED